MNDEGISPRGLGVFADYVNAVGSARMRIIAEQRKQFDDPNSGAPYAYAAALAGLRQTVRSGDVQDLRRMVFRAGRTMASHYEELADGMTRFVEREHPAFLPTNPATWMWATLPVNVNHHVGMTIKGKPRVVFLYLKKPELTSEGATKVAWQTLELTVDTTLPGADVAVLDVRRARLHVPTRKNRAQLDAWIESEALGYIEHWRRAA